jgi:hypothetical protein
MTRKVLDPARNFSTHDGLKIALDLLSRLPDPPLVARVCRGRMPAG